MVFFVFQAGKLRRWLKKNALDKPQSRLSVLVYGVSLSY
jgi:hypothetical protein